MGAGPCFWNQGKPGPSLVEAALAQVIIPSNPPLPLPYSCLLGTERAAGFCPEQRDLLPMTQGLSHSSVTKAVTSRRLPVTA